MSSTDRQIVVRVPYKYESEEVIEITDIKGKVKRNRRDMKPSENNNTGNDQHTSTTKRGDPYACTGYQVRYDILAGPQRRSQGAASSEMHWVEFERSTCGARDVWHSWRLLVVKTPCSSCTDEDPPGIPKWRRERGEICPHGIVTVNVHARTTGTAV